MQILITQPQFFNITTCKKWPVIKETDFPITFVLIIDAVTRAVDINDNNLKFNRN